MSSQGGQKCTKCYAHLPVDAFPIRSGTVRRHSWCRTCKRAYERNVYATNVERREQVRKARTSSYRRIVEQNRDFVLSYLRAHPCVDCGIEDVRVLQFDHDNAAEKEANVSELMGSSLARLVAEIEKCSVRCANCHMRRTATQFGWYAYLR